MFLLVQSAVNTAFESASQYADTFEKFREFYKENESQNLEAMQEQEHGKMSRQFSCLQFHYILV